MVVERGRKEGSRTLGGQKVDVGMLTSTGTRKEGKASHLWAGYRKGGQHGGHINYTSKIIA